MKFATHLAAVASAVALALPAQAAVTSLSGPTSVLEGQQFSIEVQVDDLFGHDALDELIAFGFDVASSNAASIAFVSASVAAPFADDSGSFADTHVAGSVFPGLTAFDVSGPFTLATLTFQALGAGSSLLGVASDPGDVNEGLVFANAGNLDLSANLAVQVLAVPEPQSYALMLAGLGLLLARARRG